MFELGAYVVECACEHILCIMYVSARASVRVRAHVNATDDVC